MPPATGSEVLTTVPAFPLKDRSAVASESKSKDHQPTIPAGALVHCGGVWQVPALSAATSLH